MIKQLSLVLWILFLGHGALAQQCEEQIQEGSRLYQLGQFAKVAEAVGSCTTSTVATEQWQSYRLLTLAYLGLNEMEKAREYAMEMLKINPRYKGNSLTDPNNLVRLLASITVIPKLSFGLAFSVGPNSSFPVVSDAYMITDQIKKYAGNNSFQFGVSSAYQFDRTWALGASAMISSKSYDLDYSFGNWDMQMKEQLTYFNVPVMARYIPELNSRIRPFVQAGGYIGFLLQADNSFYAGFKPDGSSYKLEHINSAERRNKVDYGLAAGIGASYKLREGQLFFVANYFHSAVNVVNPEKRYDYSELQQSYLYLDDDLRLNNLAIGLGYSLYLNYKVLNDK